MERESILDLSKYLNSSVRVELSGGRKGIAFNGLIINFLVKGILKDMTN